MREVALEAIARARRGDGPTLIECETYRFRGHSLADPDELRSKDEKAHYAARDPIPQLRKYMLEHGLASEADIKEIDAKVRWVEGWRAAGVGENKRVFLLRGTMQGAPGQGMVASCLRAAACVQLPDFDCPPSL